METMHAAGRRRLPPVPRPTGDRPSAGQLTVERPDTVHPVVEPAVDTAVAPATGAARNVSAVAVSAPPATEPDPTGTDRTDSGPAGADQSDTELIDTRQIAAELIAAELAASLAARPATAPAGDDTDRLDTDQLAGVVPPVTEDDGTEDDTTEDDGTEGDGTEDDATDESALEEAPVLDSAALDPAVLETLLLAAPADEQDPAQQFVARLRSSATDFAGAAGAESAVVREAVPPARHRRARCRLVLRFADGTEIDVTLLGSAGRPGRPSRHGFDRQILRWLGAGLVRDDSWLTTDPDAPDGVAVDLTAWVSAG